MGSIDSFVPSTNLDWMPMGWQALLNAGDTAKERIGKVSANGDNILQETMENKYSPPSVSAGDSFQDLHGYQNLRMLQSHL